MTRVLAACISLALVTACSGTSSQSTTIAERKGAKGRIQGFVFDVENGQPLEGVTVETYELDKKISTKSVQGFFTLDNLVASATYRVNIVQEGYVTRFFTATIGQVPQDAYDTVAAANLGAIGLAKPVGVIKGRVEFLTSGQATLPVKNATVVADYANGGSYQLVVTTTTDANGEFTLSGLPAGPIGISQSVCFLNLKDNTDEIIDFSPTCSTLTAYSTMTNYVVVRPSRLDTALGDVNIVQGVVRDVLTRLPIAGVEVSEVGKETEKVTTDTNGFYFLKTTSVNKFAQLIYKKASYADGYLEFNFTRGTTTTSNLTMLPGGASVEGKLFYANNLPAKQAEVRIDLRLSNNVNVFQLVKTNDTGDFTLTNLPGTVDGLSVSLAISPWTADPDLFPETANQSVPVVLYPGAKTPLLRQLTSNANLALIANSAFSTFIGSAEPLAMQFSLPTIQADNTFTLTDVTANVPMPFTMTYSDNDRKVVLTPVVATGQPLWAENRTYRLNGNVRANNGPNGFLTLNFQFTPRASLQTSNVTGTISGITVDTPDIDSTSRTFNLRWAPLPDAFSYALYLRTANTSRLPNYTRIASPAANASPVFAVNLGTLPSGLTAAIEPAASQPFAFGQILEFLVVPIDARGIEAAPNKGASIALKDVTPPRFDFGIAQLDDADGAAHDVRFVVRATEQLDRNTPPTTTLPTGLTFKSWAVDELTGGVEGTLVLNGSLSASANLTVQARDTSGNLSRALTVPVLLKALIGSTGFEGTGCSASAWTADTNTTCAACTTQVLPAGPSAVSSVAGTLSSFEGVCSLAFGDPDANFCGLQSTSTPLDLSGTTFDRRTINVQYRYWTYSTTGSTRSRCDVIDATTSSILATPHNVLTNATQRVWTTVASDISSLASRNTKLRCQLDTQNTCNSRGGAQIDDVRVYLK